MAGGGGEGGLRRGVSWFGERGGIEGNAELARDGFGEEFGMVIATLAEAFGACGHGDDYIDILGIIAKEDLGGHNIAHGFGVIGAACEFEAEDGFSDEADVLEAAIDGEVFIGNGLAGGADVIEGCVWHELVAEDAVRGIEEVEEFHFCIGC